MLITQNVLKPSQTGCSELIWVELGEMELFTKGLTQSTTRILQSEQGRHFRHYTPVLANIGFREIGMTFC